MLIAFHKPYGVLSQFTRDGSDFRTLAEFGFPPRVYPIGRLDADSEGLLLFSDESELNERLLHPQHGHGRVYWAQVERIPTAEALRKLAKGVLVEGRKTLPCRARLLEPQPELPPRDPPIRFRKNVPDCWIALKLVEGRNRQVRRMTAAIGHPTLRLIRVRIGDFGLDELAAGNWKILTPRERKLVIQPDARARAERVAAKKPA
jgi:23S rRNA pseudouridine2457 synthase